MDATMYNNTFNTLGMGDPVPSSECSLGSGDKFTSKENKGSRKGREQQKDFNIHATQLPYIVYTKK